MIDDTHQTLVFQKAVNIEPDQARRSFCLIVIDGPEKGATFELSTGIHILGRAAECQIVLSNPGVTRRHATITVKAHGDVIVEDMQSTNGVYIDGQAITAANLEPGHTLSIGQDVRLRLELASQSLQQLLSELYQSATRDPLTGLLNRRGFEERLEVEYSALQRHKTEGCLAVMDLDRFKAINDTWGHLAGDMVLQAFGKVLGDGLRLGDLAGRWGGEEFIVFLRATPLAGSRIVLERLREEFAEMDIRLDPRNVLRVTFSTGIVDLRTHACWRKAMERADEALYKAKEGGRNRVCLA